MKRRDFLHQMAYAATGLAVAPLSSFDLDSSKKMFFEISLAEWSLHNALFKKEMTNLDFPVMARKEFGVGVVEYVNQFFKDKAKDTTYLNELLMRCKDNGIKNHLIMIDGEGDLGSTTKAELDKAIDQHKQWVECAKYLGCATIRVNAAGKGTAEEVAKGAVEGLSRLGDFASTMGINVIVENHGGYSSNGKWLSGVMKQVNKKNVGTLPDFGNFCITRKQGSYDCAEEYDRYLGVQELMPFAKGVSAKSHDFDAQGNETHTDYVKMLKIVKKAKFKGYVGIEFEGGKIGEKEGIKLTKALLEKVGKMV
ncbi:MAG TPA: sugar phosphate isomerase/epimerase family protein [Haliscomenobacter sp.]|nr:sugar phosphate isomerase/epimerase family protein [Haliscomenobacter sp.]HOY15765.1 sugar phosphate isomerase/epimerase family protein [Haliscomenobacter sp.]